MMKLLNIFSLLILISITALAQNTDSQTRNISVIILDKKERPIRNVSMKADGTGKEGITDRSGQFVFSGMSDNDNISIMLPRYGKTVISVEGMDSIEVILRSRISYSYINNEGNRVMIQKDKIASTPPLLDVEALLKLQHFNSLIDLLQGRVAGLNIASNGSFNESGTSMVRGANSISGNNTLEPLVVIDGIAVGTLSEANAFVNVHNIKTIEVQKSGAGWGSRGANGVIMIKTK